MCRSADGGWETDVVGPTAYWQKNELYIIMVLKFQFRAREFAFITM